jgi:serine/threonine protein kinase
MDRFPTIEFPLDSGRVLASYKIEEELGVFRVGMPTKVYRAQDVQTGQRVALKVFSLHYEHNNAVEQELTRFLREIDIMQRLHHPHILPVLSIGHDARYHWFVTPYCSLGSLADYMERRQRAPLSVQEACSFAIQVCEALHMVHTQDPPILHRDIKPQNLLLADETSLMLSDFGIAHIMYQTHLTQDNKVIGTPAYMAPEQLLAHAPTDAEAADARVDIYALGCVLYELLSGNPPFIGLPQAVALAQVRLEPRPLYLVNEQVNQGLTLIVQRALAKRAEGRYPSALAFAQALRPFVEE